MELYQKMYAILCGAISDVLDILPPENLHARVLLEDAMRRAEELYIEAE